jgi:short-subunit dehydrogenase
MNREKKMKTGNSRVVIMGASSGIGAATAIAFAKQGCQLVLGARGEEGLADIAQRCREAGASVDTAVVDVTDAAAVARFARRAQQFLGEIDLWFSNVGIGVVGKFPDVPIAAHQRVVQANLIGHMNDAHAVLPIFLGQGHGIWVNMISIGGFIATPYAAAYTASKFALRGFSQALRAELHDHPHIHVCDVYRTFVDTPAIMHHAGNYTGAKLSQPPGSMAPERVAAAVLKLARRPRATTVLGAPASVLKLGQFAAPVTGPIMDRLLDRWSKRAARARATSGTIYEPRGQASGIRSGTVRPAGLVGQHKTVLALGATVAAAALGVRLLRRRT